MKPTIAIVGASTRAAAASAVRAGFQPIVADLFADADLRQIATATRIAPYPEGLLDWLRAVEPPAWMYTGALENHPDLVDEMAWIAPLWGNPGDVLQCVRSPWELAAALSDAGLLFPETRDSADDLPPDGSWLVKTYRGASGSGVSQWLGTPAHGVQEISKAGSEADFPGGRIPSSPAPFYQRRMIGAPYAAAFVADGRQAALLGVTQQLVGESWLGAGQFQYCGSITPHFLGTPALHRELLDTIARIGRVLAARFELVGVFGLDLLVEENRVWTLEVNPRYTASVEILERAGGSHLLALHAAACTGAVLPNVAEPHFNSGAHGKAILFAKRPVILSSPLASRCLTEALQTPWPTLADISPAGTLIEAGRPVLTLFASGGSAEEVERRLRRRVAELEQELYSHSSMR